MMHLRKLGPAMVGAAWILATTAALADTVSFTTSSSVDLGTNLAKLADLDPWKYTLGTEWDKSFTIGGIIGAPNTIVIPEIKILGEVIIPEVKADTRTGARMKGRVFGDVGLEFSADFIASGLEPGVGFNFAPTLTYPTKPEAGSFIKFDTTPGVQNNAAFTEEALELPGVTAQVDFFFNLGLNSSIDYGLFPVVPYNSAPFINTAINLDQRDDPNKSLVRFDASLDPDSNDGVPLPPTLTFLDGVELLGVPLTTKVGLLDDGQFLGSEQISFEIKDEKKPNAPKPRIDVGEVQVLNPFGTGGDLLQTSSDRNLKIGTSVENDTIGYTAETPLFRLGLDLDGLAAGLAFGNSFTRLEEDLKIDDTKIASITADLIDLKYGPEVGFRESVEINPDFNVTVSFHQPDTDEPVDVALDDNGSVTLMSSFQGRWGDLPEVALLTADPVEVSVAFDELTGEQSKRGAFYLSDYLEFTLLELESLNILDIVDISLPPVIRARTSLLGNLLGELELEAYTDNAAITPFALGNELQTQTFTITPAPAVLAYLTEAGPIDLAFPGRTVRKLDGDTVVNDLAAVTLVIGQGDLSSQSVADFAGVSVTDAGSKIEDDELVQRAGIDADPIQNLVFDDPTVVSEVWGLQLLGGSTYEQSGVRVWELPTLRNDGTYLGNGSMTTFRNPDGTLFIAGDGSINLKEHALLEAVVIVHAAGHTLTLERAMGYQLVQGPLVSFDVLYGSSAGVQTETFRLPDQVGRAARFINAANVFVNGGTVNLVGSDGEIYAGMTFENTATGLVDVVGDGDLSSTEVVALKTPDFINNGMLQVGPDVFFNSVGLDPNIPQNLRGSGQIRVDGGTMHFNRVAAYAPDNATFADAASQSFEIVNGGKLDFKDQAFFFAKPTFNVGAGSELTFNGLSLDGASPGISKFGSGAPIEVVNEGRVIFNSGSNNFKLAINELLAPGQEPTIIPIGLENRGVVEIRNTARLTLDAEIRDYSDGGATFDAGKWEIIGPTPADRYNNLTSDDASVARVNLNVNRVQVGQNYLTVINPGQPGDFAAGFTGDYSATDYDTFMSVNRSDITLSGRAKFAYLNTVQTNHGTLTFDNKNHFTTEGDLTNTGTINLTNGGRLSVNGRLVLDGGSLFGDATATISTQFIEVNGGIVSLAFTQPTLPLNSKWAVRERVEIDSDGNVTGVTPGIVDYGNVVFPVIGPNAEISIEGVTTELRPLRGLTTVEGKLTLDGGNVLTLDQSLGNAGQINVRGGSNLIVNGSFSNLGELNIDTDSYAKVTGSFDVSLDSITYINGVLETDRLDIGPGAIVIGSGRVSGRVFNSGVVEPGNSPGTFQTFGNYLQTPGGTLTIDLLGPDAGVDHDQLLAESAGLSGTLEIVSGPDVVVAAYGKRLDILVTDNGIAGTFDSVSGLEIDADYHWVLSYETDHVSLTAGLLGDADFNGTVEFSDFLVLAASFGLPGDWFNGDFDRDGRVEFADFLVLSEHFGESAVTIATVPEPNLSFVVLAMCGFLLRRQKVTEVTRSRVGECRQTRAGM